MVPEAINSLTRWWLHRRFRNYRNYPAGATAVLLVDVQRGLVPDASRLLASLSEVVSLARRSGFQVAYSGFDASAEHRFETPAHRLLRESLRSADGSDRLPDRLSPRSEDIVIAARGTLSAFSGAALHEQLQERGIEHLIIAGPLARITVDSSVRDGVQLGYHVTLIQDALSEEIDEAAAYLKGTLSRYAQSILSFQEFKVLAEKSHR